MFMADRIKVVRERPEVIALVCYFAYSPDRKGIHPQNHLAGNSDVLQVGDSGLYTNPAE